MRTGETDCWTFVGILRVPHDIEWLADDGLAGIAGCCDGIGTHWSLIQHQYVS
jgi:hypothetical protein